MKFYNISMKAKTYRVALAILALMGVLFAGYLSSVKIFERRCAFGESCPLFLGYPACFFGFGLFLIMFAASVWALLNPGSVGKVKKTNLFVSLLGILFAGQFVIPEITNWIQNGNPHYALFFPTCAYGLVFYVIIFILSLRRLEE